MRLDETSLADLNLAADPREHDRHGAAAGLTSGSLLCALVGEEPLRTRILPTDGPSILGAVPARTLLALSVPAPSLSSNPSACSKGERPRGILRGRFAFGRQAAGCSRLCLPRVLP